MRKLKDLCGESFFFLGTLLVVALNLGMIFVLFRRAMPILATRPLGSLLFDTLWQPMQNHFGLASFILGTVWVTLIAMVLAVPVSILSAVFLAEYAGNWIRGIARPIIDVLAGISPVIYGFWGMIALVPLVRDKLMPLCTEKLHLPFCSSDNYTGYAVLTGGMVLAVMVSPLIISFSEEIITGIPNNMREASMGLGATKWQTIKHVVLRKALPGIVAAVMLGLSRALGETMAVLMVAGCEMNKFPKSLFDTAYPLPALIANTYGEMMSIPLYDSAIFLAALILFALTAFFHLAVWLLLGKFKGAS